MTNKTTSAIDLVERGNFAPCPMCHQYSHSIGEDKVAEAFRHFQSMVAHPVRGHPMGNAFDEQTRDAAQVLTDTITRLQAALEELRDELLNEPQLLDVIDAALSSVGGE